MKLVGLFVGITMSVQVEELWSGSNESSSNPFIQKARYNNERRVGAALFWQSKIKNYFVMLEEEEVFLLSWLRWIKVTGWQPLPWLTCHDTMSTELDSIILRRRRCIRYVVNEINNIVIDAIKCHCFVFSIHRILWWLPNLWSILFSPQKYADMVLLPPSPHATCRLAQLRVIHIQYHNIWSKYWQGERKGNSHTFLSFSQV